MSQLAYKHLHILQGGAGGSCTGRRMSGLLRLFYNYHSSQTDEQLEKMEERLTWDKAVMVIATIIVCEKCCVVE